MSHPLLEQVIRGEAPPLYRFDVDQYERITELGILPEGSPIELIDGYIIHKDTGDAMPSWIEAWNARQASAMMKIKELAATLSADEKAELLQWLSHDLGKPVAGIESKPGVCGGDPCVVRTRIPAWVLEQSRRLGMTESEILAAYSTLRAEDLVNAWAYVAAHRDDIDRQIRENEEP